MSGLCKPVDPVIKWTGSKSRTMPFLLQYFPEHNRLIDPFIGGGATIPYASNAFLAGDNIPDLIQLWQLIQNQPDRVKIIYRVMWTLLQNDSDYYYKVRDLFNQTHSPLYFLFLTRTCYSGLIRYNKNGMFNSSLHFGRREIHPERFGKIVDKWSAYLPKGTFVCADYRDVLSQAKEGDFVFLDPPYIGTKGQYQAKSFDHKTLYNNLESLNNKGIKWMLTLGESDDNTVPETIYKYQFPTPNRSSSLGRLVKHAKQSHDMVYVNYPIRQSLNNYDDVGGQ